MATPIVATVTHCYQDGPDTAAKEQRHLLVSRETTVGEILAWADRYGKVWCEGKALSRPVTLQEGDSIVR